ncbi:hypothetical protein H696_01470 [Fonticula alba]|uniref:Calcium uniporter protein C-terminal domain-containing protein n=1 Tax=Fonticula alba TaxID=691883 RepID=A0A058ZF06_FONAL|nr:hypothetical protein H696_01470 [Fonticula alba]KCV72062.1 hypothetical protein H696_01470 [Fonticula alba]|eukprot:XP_009493640.1 hypothetical protein H696_01470 [Fonticula alba]
MFSRVLLRGPLAGRPVGPLRTFASAAAATAATAAGQDKPAIVVSAIPGRMDIVQLLVPTASLPGQANSVSMFVPLDLPVASLLADLASELRVPQSQVALPTGATFVRQLLQPAGTGLPQVKVGPASLALNTAPFLTWVSESHQANTEKLRELAPVLEATNRAAKKARSKRKTNEVLFLGAFVGHLGAAAWLTYGPLGWDMVEPMTYLSGLAVSGAMLTWFVVTGREGSPMEEFSLIERRNLEARLRKALTAEPHLAPVVERYGLFAQAEGSTRDAVNALVADIERELAFSRSFLPASGDHHDGDKAALEK